MTNRSITHASFVIERSFDATPERVFAAWADPKLKARWFTGPDEWGAPDYELDFRVGGLERSTGGPAGGPVYTYEAHYQDIVDNERIISSYDMRMGDVRISVSLATIQFQPEGAGTRLVLTEYGAYLDGHDTPAARQEGTEALLDQLEAELKTQVGA